MRNTPDERELRAWFSRLAASCTGEQLAGLRTAIETAGPERALRTLGGSPSRHAVRTFVTTELAKRKAGESHLLHGPSTDAFDHARPPAPKASKRRTVRPTAWPRPRRGTRKR